MSFRIAVVVMTTNAGADVTSDGLGFNPEGRSGRTEERLRQHFRPELLGRLDEILVFRSLDAAVMESIADKYLEQLRRRANQRGMELRLPPELAGILARDCAARNGARALRSLVQTKVESPLAGFLLGCAEPPAVVRGALVGENLIFS